MIRLAVLTDPHRVVGSSSARGSAVRLAALPPAAAGVMARLYEAENLAVGAGSLSAELAQLPYHHVYALTRDESYRPPDGLEGVVPIHDAMDLVRRFSDSADELLVAGGATIWRIFTPYARRIDVAEAGEPMPGDLVYDEYENGEFHLESEEEWDGGRTLHFVRTHVAADDDGVRTGPLEP